MIQVPACLVVTPVYENVPTANNSTQKVWCKRITEYANSHAEDPTQLARTAVVKHAMAKSHASYASRLARSIVATADAKRSVPSHVHLARRALATVTARNINVNAHYHVQRLATGFLVQSKFGV